MFKTIRSTIESIQDSYVLLVVTLQSLTRALTNNTARVEALSAEQQILNSRLDAIEKNTKFLANAERASLQRAGHRTDL